MADKTGSDTKLCRHCKMEIPRSAKVCPHCRKKQKKGIGKWIVLRRRSSMVSGNRMNGLMFTRSAF